MSAPTFDTAMPKSRTGWNAQELFRVGDRVRLSEEGIRLLGQSKSKVPYDRSLLGTVRGFGREAPAVRIQRDGVTTTDTYHVDFWEAV